MTWFIIKNTINKIRDSFETTYPNILVQFSNTYTCNTFTAIFTDQRGCAPVQLNIEEVCESDTDPLNGLINFDYTGQWSVRVYAQTSATNLDINLSDEFIGSRDLIVYLNDCDSCKTC